MYFQDITHAGGATSHRLMGRVPVAAPLQRLHGLQGMGQLLPNITSLIGSTAQTGANVASLSQAIQGPALMQKVDEITNDAEVYITAQLALQTLATVATFGIFLMMFYKFNREKKS
jgi:hypothetical protein